MVKMKFALVLVTLVALLSLMSPAIPALAALAIGPIDPVSVWPAAPAGTPTGFPAWYVDATGAKVTLLPITGNGRAAPTQIFLAPDPLNPYSVFLGFDSTASYFNAKATVATPNGRLTFTASLDAGFPAAKGIAGVATPGQEIVTETITVKMPLVAGQEGTYNIQEPYGKHTALVTAADIAAGKGLKFTLSVPAAPSPRIFTGALAGPITAFLKPTVAPPPGWLGDGATISTVTGSPTGFNAINVVGPAGKFTTNLFTISGRLFTQIVPVASFTMSAATGAAPLTVGFTDTSSGPPSLWSWNFGDGSAPSTLQNPSHTFLAAGPFTVTETVTNAAGTATVSHVVTVTPAVAAIPVASFTMAPTTGPAPLSVNFTDTTTGAPATWSWNFGDASATGTVQNPTHTFLTAGTFTVTELASNALGSAAASKTITVTPPVPAVPVASFTMTPATGPAPQTVNFTDTTTGVPTSWSWSFGDGSAPSTLQNPSHFYTIVGNFAVTETANNALGTSTASQVVAITGVPATAIPAAPSALAANVTSSTQVDLTWTDNANNESLFMVQRATNAAFTAGLIEMHPAANSVPAPSPVTFSDITVVASTAYFYQVLAGNTLGNSAPSNVVTVTTPAPGAPVPPPPAPVLAPPAPAPAGGGGGGGGGAPAGGGMPTGGGGGVIMPILNTSVTLNGLVSSTGLNENANGTVVANSQVKTTNDEVVMDMAAGTNMVDKDDKPITSLSAAMNTAPSAPPAGGVVISDFTLEPSGAHFDPSIALKMRFDPAKVPATIPVDKLYIGFWDGKQWVKLDSTVDKAANVITAQISHFTEFGIIAEPQAPAPSPAPATRPSPAPKLPDEIVKPSVPQDLIASATPDGKVHLSWTSDPYANENGFMIERAANNTFDSALTEFHVPAMTGTFTDETVAPGRTYFYRVEAVHGVGHSAPSNMVSVTVPTPGSPATAPAQTPAPAPAGKAMPATPWIIGGIAVVAAVVVAVLLMRKRKSA